MATRRRGRRRYRVTAARCVHILDGDATGGGHGPGRGISGKSEFPASLNDDTIIRGVESVANAPSSYPAGRVPSSGGRQLAVGMIASTRTAVVVEPATRLIISAWPLGLSRNP